MSKYSLKKAEQLGMPIGTASAKLKKKILFNFIIIQGLDDCFRCGQKIRNIDNLSIEHKIDWLNSNDPIGLFFDINNIAFSHLSCNASARISHNKGKVAKHGTITRYTYHKCRCFKCVKAKSIYRKR